MNSRTITKPRVTLLALGGTIATAPGDQGGVTPKLTGEMLVAGVPALRDIADIEASTFRQLPSPHLRYEDIEALAVAIVQARDEGATGVVITQGTDTIEETAFALDLLLPPGEMPVVVTGAMRNPTLAGADGPANLLAAVQVCTSDAARGLGCVVVSNDEIHAARFVRKTHTSSTATFSSPTAGPIGWVIEDTVRIALLPTKTPPLQLPGPVRDARVALVAVAMGDDDTVVNAMRSTSIDGMVVMALGGGHVPATTAAALEDMARGIPVVFASRTGAGEILSRTYGFPGSEIDLQRRGLVRAGWLDALKAKVLLTLLLRHGVTDRQRIADVFALWGGEPRR
ncbi:asparaginase [Ramlibacter algicola]|uniref:Asparaginase n=1 Tax=Ramlibacter algicola TaxID=2795217 RepID=A0A934Q0A5_9BURK|nr:asparaginase [Ramlibacter algicola]MBK0392121.1 asparaginase [Ramlibacter algicola]